MKLLSLAPSLLLIVALVAGCTPAGEAPGAETAMPSPTTSPTPTPSAMPALETSDPELGIDYGETPQLEGEQVDVYNTVAAYRKEYWRVMTTNVVGIGLNGLVSPEIIDNLRGIAEGNAAQELFLGGTFHAEIKDVSVEGDTAFARICDDYREVTATDPDGSYTADEVGLKNVQAKVFLQRVVGRTWTVLRTEAEGAC